jgi:ATP-dependent helicase/nuclease subunit A
MLGLPMKILEKNLLILASAGSGKTFQLGNRVIGLVAMGVAPEKIVALTFTRKAAGEFADSVLMKLAEVATHEPAAARMRQDLGLPQADFAAALHQVVRALPRFTLGTMDSFFAKVVRGFQYELGLTGGKFELLEGPPAQAAVDEILAGILGETLDDGGGDEFLHAFRRASFGKEEQGVLKGLSEFVSGWQNRYRTTRHLEWGPQFLAGVRVEEWEERKRDWVAQYARGIPNIETTDARQPKALDAVADTFMNHTIGSGSLGSPTGLLATIFSACATGSGPLRVKHYKEFLIGGPAADALRNLVTLVARCEMAAALLRTHAVREVVATYDRQHERQLRRRGRLGFEDVKILMGEWVRDEEARLRREWIDFRLDARHEHWLLDEFQDTSRADWTGLLPLIDEAAGEGEGSVFVVGDRKQAIYAWRGGEVKLFDEVASRYQGFGLQTESMAESWRSCPEVLALVNRVCGDRVTLQELFADAAERWQWQDHLSASPLTVPAKRGEARVEVIDAKKEDPLERLAALLTELGVGERAMTCGILVRSNQRVREIADELRARGFDVIEEGRREPAKDNPVGIAIGHLLKWLADPADRFAREVVEMSPLAGCLRARWGDHWNQVWEGLLSEVAERGYAAMIEQMLDDHWAHWSDFGRRRAGDVLMALAGLDAQGAATPRQAAEWIERLEVSQSPGVAAVQVMTIHKSKGLGFDVVVLPDVPNDTIPATQHFEVAEGDGWLAQAPPKWARDLIPEIREAEARWGIDQAYQDFCMLYVALTRAKRGLYVFLPKPAEKQDPDKPSLANWLARSVESTGQPGVVYQVGAPAWVETIPHASPSRAAHSSRPLAPGVARRERLTPSRLKGDAGFTAKGSAVGMRFGTEVHQALEGVSWIDEKSPNLPATDAGKTVAKMLATPRLKPYFERKGRAVVLVREQPVEAILDGKWLSGTLDRLHLHRGPDGKVIHVEVLDFKTDRIADLDALARKHADQMQAYQKVMEMAYPGATVECHLLSTSLLDFITL